MAFIWDRAAEELRLHARARCGGESFGTQLTNLVGDGVVRTFGPGVALRGPVAAADETLPCPRQWKFSMDVVPHLNIRIAKGVTMSIADAFSGDTVGLVCYFFNWLREQISGATMSSDHFIYGS